MSMDDGLKDSGVGFAQTELIREKELLETVVKADVAAALTYVVDEIVGIDDVAIAEQKETVVLGQSVKDVGNARVEADDEAVPDVLELVVG